jgi:pyruvate dehydrogenase E2 component (dihydrolipoamide acetyltransferase)
MAVSIVMPKLGMVMTEGTVTRWSKSAGDSVKQGEVLAEIETEKLNYELEATEAGILHTVVADGAIIPVDGLLGYLLAEGEAVPEAPPEPAPAAAAPERRAARRPSRPAGPGGEVASTPGARKLAASLGVDLTQVTPTGPRGRVVEADVRAHADKETPAAEPSRPPGLPEPSKVVPFAGVRKSIGDHMRSSLAQTAQLSFALELDVTEAQRARREASEQSGKPVALAHVLIKACAETLKRVPACNTILAGGEILYFDEVNVGVAVALSEGLIVPVIKSVGKKSIGEIATELEDLSERARDGKLSPDELAGGTFTISVLGSVDAFTPILNRGQSAILGIGRSVEKPVVVDGEIAVREMMTVTLTTDHQVVDGAVAASFLRRFQQIMGRPATLFK